MKALTKTRLRALGLSLAALGLAVATFAAVGVRASDHPTERAHLGKSVASNVLSALVDLPGPITVETVIAADWEVDRAGLVDLSHPEAKAASFPAGLEPIQIYAHVLRHPEKGRFLVDSGVERTFRDDPAHAPISGLRARAIHLDRLRVRRDTAAIVAAEGPLAGVLLTHLHFDHISGMPDVPRGTAIYAGPGETTQRWALNLFVKGPTDALLAGHQPIQEWPFEPDPDGRFAGVLDVLGDGSLFAIWVPGHTAGSTAYLARTPRGPVLFTGDTSHTAWGWKHLVPPGDFTRDRPLNTKSLVALATFVKEHPGIAVRLGHQALE